MKTNSRLLILLLLASPVWGQSVSDRPTGLDRLPPGFQLASGERGTPHGAGIDPAKLRDYLAAVEAVDLAAEFQTAGASRQALNVDRVHVQAHYDRSTRARPISGRSTGDDSPTLSSLTITPLANWAGPIKNLPNGSGRHVVTIPHVGRVAITGVKHLSNGHIELEVPGRNYVIDPRGRWKRGRKWNGRIQRIGNKVNKVTINRQGHLHINLEGMPDINVRKVTRDRNGDMRLHVRSILIPDIVISSRTGKASIDFGLFGEKDLGNLKMLTAFENWPPSLEDLASMKFDSEPTAEEPFAGTLSYNLVATGREGRAVEVAGVRGEVGKVHLNGVATIDKDGFRVLGDRSNFDVELQVGGSLSLNQLSAQNAGGSVRVQGRYGLRLPSNGGNVDLEVQGRLTFDLSGNTIRIRTPNGPEIDARRASANGGAAFAFTQGRDGSRLTVRDGVYRLKLDGPLRVKKLDAGRLSVSGIDLEGSATSTGRVNLDANGLQVSADLHAEGEVVNQDGIVTVLQRDMSVRARPTAGTVKVDFEELELTSPLGRAGRPSTMRTNGTSTGTGLVIEDVEVETPAGTATADRVRLDFGLGIETGDSTIKSANGNARITLESDGQLSGSATGAAVSEQRMGMVNVREDGQLNYRDAPSVDSGVILGQLSRGERVKILGDRGVWREIELKSGVRAFVHGRYLAESIRPSKAPTSANWALDLAEGSHAEVVVDETWTDGEKAGISGRVSTSLVLKSTQLKTASFDLLLLGAAQASLKDVAFEWQGGRENPLRVAERIEVPFTIALEAGTRMQTISNEIVIDQDGSRIVGRAIVIVDGEGARVESIQEVDLMLKSTGITRFAGQIVELNGEKTLTIQGRMEITKSNQIKIFGKAGITVEGPEDVPVIVINL